MSRKPFIAGNWKMNLTVEEGVALVTELKKACGNETNINIAVFPTFVSIYPIGKALEGSNILLGAQDTFWEESGAWTRQISPSLLKNAGCKWVIVGHSETRGRFGKLNDKTEAVLKSVSNYFGETDKSVNMKVKAAFAAGLFPIIACGELPSEYDAKKTNEVVENQIRVAIDGLTKEQAMQLVIAYEPVWAIGTGDVCAPDKADEVCSIIRNTVKDVYGEEIAEAVRIQYGGSVKPSNAKELLSMSNIDGALVGGASLKANDFIKIIESAK